MQVGIGKPAAGMALGRLGQGNQARKAGRLHARKEKVEPGRNQERSWASREKSECAGVWLASLRGRRKQKNEKEELAAGRLMGKRPKELY
jgi:hypothetical protein